MSYDVSLHCRCCGQTVLVEPHTEGADIQVGGCPAASMSVTYNYADHFRRVLHEQGLCWLHEKTAEVTIPWLQLAVEALGDDWDEDYWAPTEGNARRALVVLLGWAEQHPKAIWTVT